jgi:hypothetical protein
MSKKREEWLNFHFGKYESTSLENRIRISLTKKSFENMIRFYYFVNENFCPGHIGGERFPTEFIRYKKEEHLRNEMDIDEVLDEFLEKEHLNTIKYK